MQKVNCYKSLWIKTYRKARKYVVRRLSDHDLVIFVTKWSLLWHFGHFGYDIIAGSLTHFRFCPFEEHLWELSDLYGWWKLYTVKSIYDSLFMTHYLWLIFKPTLRYVLVWRSSRNILCRLRYLSLFILHAIAQTTARDQRSQSRATWSYAYLLSGMLFIRIGPSPQCGSKTLVPRSIL